MSKRIEHSIAAFVCAAENKGLCTERDRIYLINRVSSLLRVEGRHLECQVDEDIDLLTLMDNLIAYAVDHHVIKGTAKAKEQFEAELMSIITPWPGHVNDIFWQKYQIDPNLATDYFHNLSQLTNYLKTREIAKDIRFTVKSKYIDLQITINKSKPEKTSEEILLQKNNQHLAIFPKCALCIENEGFEGSISQPARQNHRLIKVNMEGENFYLQYSPYAYYNEHSIFINELHKPMVMTQHTFKQILEIVNYFPQYFVGSNAELPIVGGSILSHEHFQAGKHIFPMDEAESFYRAIASEYDDCEVLLLKWPASVIKLRHTDMDILISVASTILEKWRNYTNLSLDILAASDQELHNTVTPIARKNGDTFELSLVLRNNRTSENYPNGIFHPHPHLHHIKKENIGLIEVMGMAILPARIEHAMDIIQEYFSNKLSYESIPAEHQDWVQYLDKKYSGETSLDWTQILQDEIGLRFEEILENVGVFKQDSTGQAAFIDFVSTCLK